MTVRRAAHFVPGANEKMLNKSLATAADSLILDLEDAVTPDNKDSARTTVAGWLADVDFGRQERVVRINPLSTPWCANDIAETMVAPPDAYLVPKVSNLDELTEIDDHLTQLEHRYGHQKPEPVRGQERVRYQLHLEPPLIPGPAASRRRRCACVG